MADQRRRVMIIKVLVVDRVKVPFFEHLTEVADLKAEVPTILQQVFYIPENPAEVLDVRQNVVTGDEIGRPVPPLDLRDGRRVEERIDRLNPIRIGNVRG